MSIRDWPAHERPREKLLRRGAESLSDAELLAIFLGAGVRNTDAVETARRLLHHFGSLRALLSASPNVVLAQRGIGTVALARLRAALELACRHFSEPLVREDVFLHPEAVRSYLRARLRDLGHEVFCCLFLDNRHRLIVFETLFRGTVDGATVHVREVVKQALSHNAAAVILAHNHPSGVAEPSAADEAITIRLQSALELVGIRTLDHVIVGDIECVSLAERGLL